MPATERQNQLVNVARGLEIKKAQRSLAADEKFSEVTAGMQPSAMTSEALHDVMGKIPVDVLAESPRAQQFMQMASQVNAREAQADARREAVNARYLQIEQMADAARERAQNTQLNIQERAAADKRHQALMQESQRIREEAAKQNIELRREIAGLPPKGEGGKPADPDAPPPAGIEAAVHAWLIKGEHMPVRGGVYQAGMKYVERLARDNGMTVQALVSASADVKTRLMAKKTFETRVQNLGRAENQLELEIPVMEDAIKNLDLPSIPLAARGKIAVLRQMGNPDVVKLDQAAETVFREFEGIVTGNPGTLNVQDVVNAHNDYKAAQTPETMKAAIQGMRRIITNAKKANDKTRKEIMGGIDDALKGKEGGDPGADPSAQPKTPAKVMKFDEKGNLVSG
jgi:hypothetical protein